MTSDEFVAHLQRTGWTRDPYHKDWFTKDMAVTGEARHARVRIQKTSIRIELKSSVNATFFRIGGCAFSQLSKGPAGDVFAASYRFPRNG